MIKLQDAHHFSLILQLQKYCTLRREIYTFRLDTWHCQTKPHLNDYSLQNNNMPNPNPNSN